MTLDHDGKIRMDCSSPYAMAGLVALKDQFDIAWGNDPDADRHGIVTRSAGLMNPNHYLAVAIRYLLSHRPGWPPTAAVGKTLVSSSLIDRVVAELGRQLLEVPVGFKWFVARPVRWVVLLRRRGERGREFPAAGRHGLDDRQGRDRSWGCWPRRSRRAPAGIPGEHYRELAGAFGSPSYTRIDAPATRGRTRGARRLSPRRWRRRRSAGEPITAKLTKAPGNGAPIGGLKVVTENGWFAARPSGTENIYKIYAESFNGTAHLEQVLREARDIVNAALTA